MFVKPQEEWTEDIFEDMIADKPLPPTLEQRVGKLEKYEKEELIQRDIVRHHLKKLENNKDIKIMCNMFVQKLIEMRVEQRRGNACIARLEKSDKKLRVDLHRICHCQPAVPNNRKG
jgi:hypothetical protein